MSKTTKVAVGTILCFPVAVATSSLIGHTISYFELSSAWILLNIPIGIGCGMLAADYLNRSRDRES